MAISDGDILAVKFCQRLFSRDVCMVWTVTTKNPSGAIDLIDLITSIRDIVGPLINAAQSNDVLNVSVSADNWTDGLTFAETGWTGTGAIAQESASSFVAAGIKLTRGTKVTRNGYKRLAGVTEPAIVDGQLDSGYITAQLTPLANMLSNGYQAVIGGTETVDVVPVIVGRTETPAGSGKYLPDLTRVQNVVGFSINARTTSQVSRK